MKLLVAAFVLAACLLASAQTGAPPQKPEAAVRPGDEPAATAKPVSFRLKGIDGKIYDSTAMTGEVLVVSFGATWCVPCVWELVAIEELKEEYARKPVRFLWVSIEDAERTSDNILRHYARERGLTIPVLRDPTLAAYSQFSTTTRIPLVAFFDREGRFNAPAHRGMPQDLTLYKKLVRDRVNALLEAKAVGAAPPAAAER